MDEAVKEVIDSKVVRRFVSRPILARVIPATIETIRQVSFPTRDAPGTVL